LEDATGGEWRQGEGRSRARGVLLAEERDWVERDLLKAAADEAATDALARRVVDHEPRAASPASCAAARSRRS
jgi:hypothetical protein